ncbi:MAG: anthranilate synthase component I [Bacteroidetes bacterium]|nr:anthranilate synthase component I [Bacteroidota bacterium]
MTFEAFQETVRTQRRTPSERLIIPMHRRRSADLLTPVSAFLHLREGAHMPFLLESVEGGEKLARYSFLGRNPYRTVTARGQETESSTPSGSVIRHEADLFAVLDAFITEYREVRLPDLPRLTGGAVGFFGYDCIRLIEAIPDRHDVDPLLPDAVWAFYDTICAFDHVKHQLVLIRNVFVDPGTDLGAAWEAAGADLDALEQLFSQPSRPSPDPVRLEGEWRSNMTRETFESAVEQAQHYIREGDIFQVVLSQRFSASYRGDPFNLYRALRQVNPSPYLFYLDFGAFRLVGSSPEVLVRIEEGRAELLPIAGTRPRGATPEEDARLAEDLLADRKERAEHLMLVDLGRNDLGRVSAWGTVEVERYAFIERYSHVMHIVSSVASRLAADRHAMDALKACFPAGTVSGAPKVRAMEIIDELETTRRGPYAGAVGYLDFRGNLDTCITIRTMLVTDDTVHMQAGAGIVADSAPSSEYEETINKARALRTAMNMAASDLL